MSIDVGIAAAGLFTGVVVGLTGMGGGALMTPILVLGFGVQPLAAVSSDLVAAVVMKPIGGGIHSRRGTVHWGLVRWLSFGSVPGALVGAWAVSHLGAGAASAIRTALGVALLLAVVGMLARWWFTAHRADGLEGVAAERVAVHRIPTLLIGLAGGVIVGMTSVGSGSLMIVALMLLYPTLSSKELVGTDLVQAIPLVVAGAVGHLIWGDFQFGVTSSLLIGAIPGVIIGSHISSRASDSVIRPALVTVLTLSGMKLLGASNVALLVTLIVIVAIIVASLVRGRTGIVLAVDGTDLDDRALAE